jgi:hypothetical protein
MDAVETMKKTKKWEAPPGVSMDIDMEGLLSKVHEERSAGTLPAIRQSASTTDVAASSIDENKAEESRQGALRHVSRFQFAAFAPSSCHRKKCSKNTSNLTLFSNFCKC